MVNACVDFRAELEQISRKMRATFRRQKRHHFLIRVVHKLSPDITDFSWMRELQGLQSRVSDEQYQEYYMALQERMREFPDIADKFSGRRRSQDEIRKEWDGFAFKY